MLDRRIIGKNFPPLLNEIEKGAIRRFADAYGDGNPVYRDEEAARAAGYRNVLAPPTFPATLGASVNFFEVLGITHRSVLVGEQSFEYHQPICAGDRVVVTSRVVDMFEKPGAGGTIDFAIIEDEGRDEKGQLIYRARKTLVVQPVLRTENAQ